MKRFLSCALVCLLCFSMAACGQKKVAASSKASGPATPKSYQISLLLARDDAYAKQLIAGAQSAADAAEADVSLDVQYAGDSLSAERAALDALDPADTQGVLCLPVSSDASIAALNRVRERGVLVAITGVSSESTSFASAAIAYNAHALGKASGDIARSYIENTFSGKANVAIIHNNGAQPVESALRQNGFLEALDGLESIQVVGVLDLSGGANPQERVTAFLTDHTNIDVIFCTTGQGLTATHQAVVGAKYKAALFGVDAYQDVLDIMRSPDNTIQGVAAQDFFEMGSAAMTALLDAVQHTNQDASTPTLSPILLRPDDEQALSDFEAK